MKRGPRHREARRFLRRASRRVEVDASSARRRPTSKNSSTQEQRKKKANDLKNSSTAKQKEKDDVRKLLDKKPKKAKKKKALEKAPLGALKTTDKKSELAPIGKAASPVAKKEPTRTGDHLGEVKKEPTRTGGDDADRPPSRTAWKSNARWRGLTLMPTQVAHAQQARGGRLRF